MGGGGLIDYLRSPHHKPLTPHPLANQKLAHPTIRSHSLNHESLIRQQSGTPSRQGFLAAQGPVIVSC